MFSSNRFFSILRIDLLYSNIKNWTLWRHLFNAGCFTSDRLRCSLWVFIPVIFIVFSFTLLCIRFTSKPGVFIGKQSIQVRGQLICCVDPFLHNLSYQNYSRHHTNCNHSKPPIFNVNNFGLPETDIIGNILSVANSNFTATEEIQSHNMDCHDSDDIYTSNCLIFPYHRIELYDFDWLTADDFLNETHTDENGIFELSGQVNEIFPMLPYIVIIHQCFESKIKTDENGNKFDFRKSYYSVASYHVNKGVHSLFPLNLQTLGWRDIHLLDN